MTERLARKIAHPTLRAVLSGIAAAESLLCRDRPLRYPPLFIVGPPRCGTTLLGQVVCSALNVAYVPNLAVRLRLTWHREPPVVFLTWLARRLGYTGQPETFQSRYGSAQGLGSSSDNDFIWRLILPPEPMGHGDLTPRQRRFLRRVTSGVERVFGRPYVEKCVGHSIRVPALLDVFPNAIWVRCRREPMAVAQSVWLGRTGSGRVTDWPTPKVEGWKELAARPLVEQAATQQWLFEQALDGGLGAVPAERHLDVSYEAVCRNPKAQLERITALLIRTGVPVQYRSELPSRFPNERTRRVPPGIHEQLRAHVERVWGQKVEPLREPGSPCLHERPVA